MSAVPKYKKNPGQIDPKIARLPSSRVSKMRTSVTVMPPQASRIVERLPYPGEISAPSGTGLLRFEKAICFAVIIFALMTLSSVSHRALTSKIDARDLRIAIQRTETDISRLREDLQQAQTELVTFDAPEGLGTLPIEPGDVASVTLTGLR